MVVIRHWMGSVMIIQFSCSGGTQECGLVATAPYPKTVVVPKVTASDLSPEVIDAGLGQSGMSTIRFITSLMVAGHSEPCVSPRY
jgi:hypothetical protein